MKKIETPFEGLYIIEFARFEDSRGFFCETYNREKLEALGLPSVFDQDNHSRSIRGVVRGLHFQTSPGQAKLVRCTLGSVWDVAVDIRPDSPTYKQWFGVELTDSNCRMLFIPVGFAHGFAALSDVVEFQYKCSSVYNPLTEAGFRYDDPEIAVDWKIENPIVSDRDRIAKSFKEIETLLKEDR